MIRVTLEPVEYPKIFIAHARDHSPDHARRIGHNICRATIPATGTNIEDEAIPRKRPGPAHHRARAPITQALHIHVRAVSKIVHGLLVQPPANGKNRFRHQPIKKRHRVPNDFLIIPHIHLAPMNQIRPNQVHNAR